METPIVITENDKKVGHLKYAIIEGDEQVPSHIELLAIWVDDSCRGKGYGTLLINELFEICKAKKISSCFTFVTKDNESFKSFMKKNKFQEDSQKELWHYGWS